MKIRSPFITRLAAALTVGLLRLLFRTGRIEIHLEQPGINPYGDTGPRRYLYCVWHDQLVMPLFAGRGDHAAALVSRHHDGSFLVEALKRLGITAVRGSASRGGARALRQLIDATRNLHVVITPDGPRGPRREMKSGIVYLASRTGRPVVPTAYACSRSWSIRGSWTDMQIPKPFSRIIAVAGNPVHVPPDLDRNGIEHWTAVLQSEMQRLLHLAEQITNGDSPSAPERRAA